MGSNPKEQILWIGKHLGQVGYEAVLYDKGIRIGRLVS